MTEQEKQWINLCKTEKEKYRIDVDNDSVFVTDEEKDEFVFEFRHYGWKLVIDLLRYIGCNAEAV